MTGEELFRLWAPPESPWSLFAKPSLFAQILPALPPAVPPSGAPPPVPWAPSPSESTAVVVDLPGEESVETGLALALRGLRPVPLFNTTTGPRAALPADAILARLLAGAASIASVSANDAAPPAFLLDRDRRRGRSPLMPGDFDNRWVVFPQDFPSAALLASRGIRRALLVTRGAAEPADDLAHVLLRWQEGGLEISLVDLDLGGSAAAIRVKRPRHYRSLWARLLVGLGLRQNAAGGFGGALPDPHAGGAVGFG